MPHADRWLGHIVRLPAVVFSPQRGPGNSFILSFFSVKIWNTSLCKVYRKLDNIIRHIVVSTLHNIATPHNTSLCCAAGCIIITITDWYLMYEKCVLGPGWELGECRQCRSGEHLDVNLIADQPLAPGFWSVRHCHLSLQHCTSVISACHWRHPHTICNYCNLPTWKYHNVTTPPPSGVVTDTSIDWALRLQTWSEFYDY